jgi:hypothetical protein
MQCLPNNYHSSIQFTDVPLHHAFRLSATSKLLSVQKSVECVRLATACRNHHLHLLTLPAAQPAQSLIEPLLISTLFSFRQQRSNS